MLKEDCKVDFITFEDQEAEESIRYTLSFLISYVTQNQFEGIGIADIGVNNEDFYCDFQTPIKNLNKDDLKLLNKSLNKLIESNPTIEVSEVSKETAQQVLGDKKYMKYHVENSEDSKVKIAKIGDYTSLISYPIISNLSKLKNYKLKNISSTNWLKRC